MDARIATDPGLGFSAHTMSGITVIELAGELDIASAPGLRERLLGLLSPGSGRLVADLSRVSFCDASGLAVLVSTSRRARLLGGSLRLAAVSPQVEQALHITGLLRKLPVFPTVQAAATGLRAGPLGSASPAARRRAARAYAGSEAGRARAHPPSADAGELREAVTALLNRADAWRDADPGRRFTPALNAMARAREDTDDMALAAAARSVLAALARYPLSHSPAVAVTATRLRRAL